MGHDIKTLLDSVCGKIHKHLDITNIHNARRRHADVLTGRETDYLPLSFAAPAPDTGDLPDFDWKQQFNDPAKSLYMQLKDNVLPQILVKADNVPWVRADTGVINPATIFGVDYDVPKHTKPVVTKPLTKDQLREFSIPADISQAGIMPRVREHMEHHLNILRDCGLSDAISVCHCDQQGPFDIATQVYGHDILIDFYESPDFVHELMSKCTKVYVAVTKLCKRINGENSGSGNAVGVWMDKGAVRMCADSEILVSAEIHKEFMAPYNQQAFSEVGPGWLHYCGGVKGFKRAEGLHLHQNYAAIEGLKGLNYSTAGDTLAAMREIKKLGVVNIAGLPRNDGEELETYLGRYLSVYDTRTGAMFCGPDFRSDDETFRAMEIWHKLQDCKY